MTLWQWHDFQISKTIEIFDLMMLKILPFAFIHFSHFFRCEFNQKYQNIEITTTQHRCIFTTRQWMCRKVMHLVLSVCSKEKGFPVQDTGSPHFVQEPNPMYRGHVQTYSLWNTFFLIFYSPKPMPYIQCLFWWLWCFCFAMGVFF